MLRASFIFSLKESLDFPGFKTPQLHKNPQSAEVTSSKNATRNVADNYFSPDEARPVKLKVEDSVETNRILTSERDTEETKPPTNEFKVRHDELEDGDIALPTNKADSPVAPSDSCEGELHLKEEHQRNNQVRKTLQIESGEEKCQHDGKCHLNGQTVGCLYLYVFEFSSSMNFPSRSHHGLEKLIDH